MPIRRFGALAAGHNILVHQYEANDVEHLGNMRRSTLAVSLRHIVGGSLTQAMGSKDSAY